MSKKKSDAKDESEYVVVQVRVPKAVAEFFNAFAGSSIQAFCEEELTAAAEEILQSLAGVYCVDVSEIVERYDLERFLDWRRTENMNTNQERGVAHG